MKRRLTDLLSFFETMTGWYSQMNKLPTSILLKAVKLGDKVFRLLPGS
jgi:hypothetical protein